MHKHYRLEKQKAYISSLERAIAGDIHPYQTCFFITGACNLKCSYCAQKKSLINSDMSLEDWKRVADNVYSMGNRMISLVGGEPLHSPFVLDLVDYISKRDTVVSLLTNGLCLNKELLFALDEAGLDSLGFSIDTLDNDRHPQFGKSLTEELERILKDIVQLKFSFRTSAAAVVTKYNLAILPDMLRRFSELGIPFRFSLMVRGVVNHSYTEAIALGEEDLLEVEKTFEKLWAMKSQGYLLGNEDCFFTQLKPKMGVCTPAGVYQMYTGGPSPHSCEGGIYYLAILNDGMIESCTTGVPSSTHIFDLKSNEDYRSFIKMNKEQTNKCTGCPWPHRWVLTHLKETGGYNHFKRL